MRIITDGKYYAIEKDWWNFTKYYDLRLNYWSERGVDNESIWGNKQQVYDMYDFICRRKILNQLINMKWISEMDDVELDPTDALQQSGMTTDDYLSVNKS